MLFWDKNIVHRAVWVDVPNTAKVAYRLFYSRQDADDWLASSEAIDSLKPAMIHHCWTGRFGLVLGHHPRNKKRVIYTAILVDAPETTQSSCRDFDSEQMAAYWVLGLQENYSPSQVTVTPPMKRFTLIVEHSPEKAPWFARWFTPNWVRWWESTTCCMPVGSPKPARLMESSPACEEAHR